MALPHPKPYQKDDMSGEASLPVMTNIKSEPINSKSSKVNKTPSFPDLNTAVFGKEDDGSDSDVSKKIE